MSQASRAFVTLAKGEASPFGAGARAPFVQRSQRIGRAGDAFEQEADRVADWVVGPAAGAAPSIGSVGDAAGVQRLAADRDPAPEDGSVVPEDQDRGRTSVQRLARGDAGVSAPADLGASLASSQGGGRPLDPGVRDLMESRLGHSFERVRVHADAEGARLSDSIGARAFAHHRDLYFAAGEYRPGTHEGRRVLAHELVHVIQQGGAPRTGGAPAVSSGAAVGVSGSAPAVSGGAPAVSTGAAPAVQRLSAPGAVVQEGVDPWGDGAPTGRKLRATTDAGSPLEVWEAYSPWKIEWHYWCHGHSLGSFAQYGYSVYSGAGLATVIRDEYRPVPTAQIRAGDIAVWTSGWDHSARFVTPVITGGALDPNQSILSTKNGKSPLDTSATLTSIIGVYGSAGIAAYRHV